MISVKRVEGIGFEDFCQSGLEKWWGEINDKEDYRKKEEITGEEDFSSVGRSFHSVSLEKDNKRDDKGDDCYNKEILYF